MSYMLVSEEDVVASHLPTSPSKPALDRDANLVDLATATSVPVTIIII